MIKHGPFDGFLAFSGGQTFFRYLYRVLFHKDAQTYSSVLPKLLNQPIFLISAGAHFTHGHVTSYKGKEFREEDEPHKIPVDALFL